MQTLEVGGGAIIGSTFTNDLKKYISSSFRGVWVPRRDCSPAATRLLAAPLECQEVRGGRAGALSTMLSPEVASCNNVAS